MYLRLDWELDDCTINPLDKLLSLRGEQVKLTLTEFQGLITHPLMCEYLSAITAAQLVRGQVTWVERVYELTQGEIEYFTVTLFGVELGITRGDLK